MGKTEDLEAIRRRGEALVAMSEQAVVVFTREPGSVHHLGRWAAQNCAHAEQVDNWLNSKDQFLAIAMSKDGSAKLASAKDLTELAEHRLSSLGSADHGLGKSLCKVMSADPQLLAQVAAAWVTLGGLSVSTLFAER